MRFEWNFYATILKLVFSKQLFWGNKLYFGGEGILTSYLFKKAVIVMAVYSYLQHVNSKVCNYRRALGNY